MTIYGGSTTVNTDVFNPETLVEAVQGAFAQKTAFMGSLLASQGIVTVRGQMPVGGPSAIGTTVTIPYFGTIGAFVNNPDGSAVSPSKIKQTNETNTVTRDSLAFQVSRWAEGNASVNPNVGDPYEEAARQIVVAAQRAMDSRIITAASAAGVYVSDVYSSSVPVTISWDMCVDAKFQGWGDEQDDVAAILVHSQTYKDMLKLKDTTGRPLLLDSQTSGGPVDRFAGLAVVVSDRVPITGSTQGAVTSSGTSPPVATLTGTPLGAFKLQIDCVVGGAHGTATYRFSTDNGNTWSANVTTNATPGTAVALTDTAVDSQVGLNGATGLLVAFAAGTFNADNLYTSTTSVKATSLLLKKGALAFWYADQHLRLQTAEDVTADTDIAAMHLYGVAHRYRRVANGTKAGVVQLTHNVSGF
jgi:hypothetical protein